MAGEKMKTIICTLASDYICDGCEQNIKAGTELLEISGYLGGVWYRVCDSACIYKTRIKIRKIVNEILIKSL